MRARVQRVPQSLNELTSQLSGDKILTRSWWCRLIVQPQQQNLAVSAFPHPARYPRYLSSGQAEHRYLTAKATEAGPLTLSR